MGGATRLPSVGSFFYAGKSGEKFLDVHFDASVAACSAADRASAERRAAPCGRAENSPDAARLQNCWMSSAVRYGRPAIFTGCNHPALTQRHPVVSLRPISLSQAASDLIA